MEYRTNIKNGDKISALAYGCMRLPNDDAKVAQYMDYAIKQGINYFDTAYLYPNKEALLGKALATLNARDKVKIATKMPSYMVNKYDDLDKIFATQLKRLKTDYVDYYLMHMLVNVGEWQRLVNLGILNWLEQKKATGKIINFGFSYHGGQDGFKGLIDSYTWDFCMIQYNYYDIHNQAGYAGLNYAADKGLPIMIMTPLRGGRLAVNLPPKAKAVWDAALPKRSPSEWGLRWLWNHPQILTVLSGMNSLEMLEENINATEGALPQCLTEAQLAYYDVALEALLKACKVNCTGCNYCVPCPRGVNIPLCFDSYNSLALHGKIKTLVNHTIRSNGHNAGLCNKCGKCEGHCPQQIPIRKELANTAAVLEKPLYKPLIWLVKRVMKLR